MGHPNKGKRSWEKMGKQPNSWESKRGMKKLAPERNTALQQVRSGGQGYGASRKADRQWAWAPLQPGQRAQGGRGFSRQGDQTQMTGWEGCRLACIPERQRGQTCPQMRHRPGWQGGQWHCRTPPWQCECRRASDEQWDGRKHRSRQHGHGQRWLQQEGV